MSHFTLVVVGENINEQLAPFAEQGFDAQYASFEDVEEQYLDEYNNKEVDIVVLKDGTLTHRYRDDFKKFDAKTMQSEYVYPEGSIIRKGKFIELFSTFEEFMADWVGHKCRDSKTNKFGYWFNPNAKWDWYKVGGRWTGYFKKKEGSEGTLGKPGIFEITPKEGYVDSLKIKDIDFEGMEKEIRIEANLTYDKLESVLNGRTFPSWKDITQKHGEDIKAARIEYHEHPVVKDMVENKFFVFGEFEETFGKDREDYIQKTILSSITPFAVLNNGQWFERGEMGWWGCVSNEKDQREWSTKFNELIKSLDPETTLTLVDCHI